jgi:hypothetical protein
MERTALSFKSFFIENKIFVLLWVFAIIFSTVSFWYAMPCLILLVALGGKHQCKDGKWAIILLSLIYLVFLYFARRNPGVAFTNALWYTVLPFLAFLIGRNFGIRVSVQDYFRK